MATRWAVANGNWSALATWDGGASLPGANDDVYADGKTVTIDQDVTVLSIRTSQRSGGTTGGAFNVSTNRTINVTGTGVVGNAAITTSGTAVVALNGNINQSSATNNVCLSHGSSGTLTVTGNVTGGGGTGQISMSATGPVVIIGTVTGGAGSTAHGISSSGTVTVTGSVVGSAGGGSAIVNTAAAGTVSITGSVTANNSSTSSGIAVVALSGNSSTKWHSIVGTVTAGITTGAFGNHAITDSNTAGGGVAIGGSLIDSSQGDAALYVRRVRCIPTLNTTRQQTSSISYPTGGMITYGSLDYIPYNVPTPANVRSGVVYGDNGFTGTCAVPVAASVAYGVLVDATTGTAALSPSDVAALVGAQIVAALNSTP